MPRPPVQVFERPDGFTEVYVGCEHDDFARNDVRALIRFHRVDSGRAWSVIINDAFVQASPEAIHACLGVALREMAAHSDGGARDGR